MARRRLKGEGSIYQRANGQWVYSRDLGIVGGKRVRKTATARTLAALRPKIVRLDALVSQGVLPERVTVAAWLDYWLDHIVKPHTAASTHATYSNACRLHIEPTIGRVELQKVRPDHVRAMHSALAEQGRTPQSIAHTHRVLKAAMAAAMRDQRIATNPVTLVRSPAAPTRSHPSLSLESAHQVLTAAESNVELLRWSLALLLGVRRGEALGLQWGDFDLAGESPSVTIERQWTPRGTVSTPKTRRSVRTIPLPRGLVTLAAACHAEAATQWVFSSVDGRDQPSSVAYDNRAWKRALSRAGVPDTPLHGARATAATWMRAQGTPEHVIADILGQVVIIPTYLHSDDGQRRKALEALGESMLPRVSGE